MYAAQQHWTEVLGSCDQLALWEWILADFAGIRPVRLHERFCSPLRQDNNPGCYLSWGHVKSEYIVLNDWAERNFHGYTAIDAIMYLRKVDFHGAIDIISNEFLGVVQTVIPEEPHTFASKVRPSSIDWEHRITYAPRMNEAGDFLFNSKDKMYWSAYGISSKNLLSDHVHPVYFYRHNTRENPEAMISVTPPDITYALADTAFEGRVKIYRPRHGGRMKWRTNCTSEDVGFSAGLVSSDAFIITKSYKDARVLRNLGMQAVWVQSEGSKPTDWLERIEGMFNMGMILFDGDDAGRRESRKLQSVCRELCPGTEWLARCMPTEIDVADTYKLYGKEVLESTVLGML